MGKLCKRCGAEFPNRILIDSVEKNLSSRKYCLSCSPWGTHNTKKLDTAATSAREESDIQQIASGALRKRLEACIVNRTNTKHYGDIGEVRVLSRFIELGYRVSVPFGDNCPYDLVVDDGKQLLRVQCKYSSVLHETDAFLARCHTRGRRGTENYCNVYTPSDTDYVAVYSPKTEKVYLIPIEDFGGKRELRLRLSATLNGQMDGVRMASEYVL